MYTETTDKKLLAKLVPTYIPRSESFQVRFITLTSADFYSYFTVGFRSEFATV